MAEHHVSLPKPFSSGGCGTLVSTLELTSEQQDDYVKAKKAMEKAMLPMNFILLDDFHCRKFYPGESISIYVHNLRKFLSHALPERCVTQRNHYSYTNFWWQESWKPPQDS